MFSCSSNTNSILLKIMSPICRLIQKREAMKPNLRTSIEPIVGSVLTRSGPNCLPGTYARYPGMVLPSPNLLYSPLSFLFGDRFPRPDRCLGVNNEMDSSSAKVLLNVVWISKTMDGGDLNMIFGDGFRVLGRFGWSRNGFCVRVLQSVLCSFLKL